MAVQAIPTRTGAARAMMRQRAELWRRPAPDGQRGPSRRLLLGELAEPLVAIKRLFGRRLVLPPTRRPRVVMLLPGFGTHPLRMRRMARLLEASGHTVKRWGLGFNLGPSEENFELLERRVGELHARYGQPLVLVGWSLGGIFAREIAKRQPDAVAKVVSMGSPFSGSVFANNAWRIYQLVTGHAVDQPPVHAVLAAKPPVETIAMWSPRDGVIAPRSACGLPGERDRALALRCTHLGFASSDEAITAVWKELETA